MSSTISSVRSSPIPDLAYDSYRSMSLRDQTLVKRHLTTSSGSGSYSGHPIEATLGHPSSYLHHNVNNGFGTNGQGPSSSSAYTQGRIMQTQDMRTGKISTSLASRRPSNFVVSRGMAYSLEKYWGESLAFWILLGVLTLLVIANSILTFVIYGVLRLGVGMESIEFLPRHLKFFGNTDLDEIYKRDGIIQGFQNKPMEIYGDNGGEVHLWVREGSQPSLSVERNVINITKVNGVRVVDKRGREMFSTNTPTLGLPRGVQKLDVRVAKTNRITSAVNATLQLESTSFTYLRGSEGTHIEGKQFIWKADQDIVLKSVNGSILMQGKEGIYLNVHDLPLVRESGVTRQSYTYTTHGKKEPQYQLCICMPDGKLFRIEIPVNNMNRPAHQRVGCHHAKNPC
ncbi:unnamed protein product [Orchesella dallaii]|uniref:Beta-sarcoglycan n=1 Tax=Orchesella dallaii TaxID=48710 RepID=A0ABP1Q963_9HEXA